MNANGLASQLIDYEIPDLTAELWALLEQIPRGSVTTYGRLAKALGSRQAAVWVGEFMLHHSHRDVCPCHRVVRHHGELGRYITGNTSDKAEALMQESVEVRNGCVDLNSFLFDAFQSNSPLVHLIEIQNEIPKNVRLIPFPKTPEIVAGVDVSYTSTGLAVGACVLVETATGELVHSVTVQKEIVFPYISGFLAFREIPVLQELIKLIEAENGPLELILVDGNGILHHRRAGIATHLGVLLDRPTIGIGKKLLCGDVDLDQLTPDEPRPVSDQNEVIGMAVKATASSRQIFVSPGHRISVNDSVRIVGQLFHGHRLPEPIYLADKLSREVVSASSTDQCQSTEEKPPRRQDRQV
ncbi:MAG: endonuclease V [Planctomycetes bacterium]|nr:endonuclease V [Planctomycetota bacterium]